MNVLIFVAAGSSVLLSEVLQADSLAMNLLNVAWILAPYLVLTAVMVIAEKRTSLLATAVATLLGAVGALTSVVMMTLFEGGIGARLLPIYQAGAIAVLVPTCKWLVARNGREATGQVVTKSKRSGAEDVSTGVRTPGMVR